MACTWVFAANNCVLEVTEQPSGLIDQNFNLASITWTEHGTTGISLRDGDGNQATYNIDSIPAFATVALFIAFLEPLRDACAPPTGSGGGGWPVPTAGTATVNTIAATGAGSTTANAQSVAVTNVGVVNGTFNGVVIPPGFSLSIEAYHDPVAGVYNRLPAIAYNGTSTTLIITEVL